MVTLKLLTSLDNINRQGGEKWKTEDYVVKPGQVKVPNPEMSDDNKVKTL